MQNSRVGRQTVSQVAGKQQVSILMSLVLFIALSVIPSLVAQAQVECLGACEAQFAACVGHSGHCQDSYEICVDGCLVRFAALLG
jgi:hypothetical protein